MSEIGKTCPLQVRIKFPQVIISDFTTQTRRYVPFRPNGKPNSPRPGSPFKSSLLHPGIAGRIINPNRSITGTCHQITYPINGKTYAIGSGGSCSGEAMTFDP